PDFKRCSLADAVRWKRGLAAVGVVMIAASSLILALWPRFPLVARRFVPLIGAPERVRWLAARAVHY
ncbi:MAG: hypothetical protein ACREXY_10865, partial [Gammaproteobacteria bacterium]